MAAVKYEEYLPILNACDVNTICDGFDEGLICELYQEFVNRRIPKSYSLPTLARKVKEVADLIATAQAKMENIGVRSIEDVCSVVGNLPASEIFKKYDRDTLYSMYLFVFKHKPLSTQGAMEYARAVYFYVHDMRRAEVLLK